MCTLKILGEAEGPIPPELRHLYARNTSSPYDLVIKVAK